MPTLGRPMPQFSHAVSLFEQLLAGKAPAVADLFTEDVRAKGIGPMMTKFKPDTGVNPAKVGVNFIDTDLLQNAWAFGVVSLSCPVVSLSSQPVGGLTTMCLPFISLPGDRPYVEPMLKALGVLVWHVARAACPKKATWGVAKLAQTLHKAQRKDDKDEML